MHAAGGAGVRVLWSTADWARAIAELPIEGPLPAATVIVPDERAAHALRRELLRLGHGRLLVGTRFVSPFTLARETLAAAGVEFAAGEEELRPLRLRALFAELRAIAGKMPALRYFDPEQLHAMPGWDEALARTITEMEAGGLTPEDLLRSGHKRAADVGTLWREIDRSAGNSWSAARVMLEAAGLLGSFRPVHGPALAAVTGHETTVHAAFLRALPRCTLVVFGARPLRDEHVARVGLLFGDEVAAALRDAKPPPAGSTDRDRLAARLFGPPGTSMPAGRPATFDHSVSIEQHAGIEDEIEAAADWVVREIVEHRTPLEEIAVLLPALDPLAGWIADRPARLPWKDGTLPVHVAGGLPATGAAAGVRILAILRALREFLPADRVAALLPWLRLDGGESHLSAGRSMELAFALGTVGGGVSNPRGALEWKARLAAREAALDRRTDHGGETPREEHRAERRRRERLLRDIRAVRVSLEMLADLAGRVLDGEPLRDLLAPFRVFLTERVLLPVAGDVPVQAVFLDRLDVACKAGVVGDLRGDDALGFMQAAIESLRLGAGRFGDPAVYVGTIAGAAPLPFRAVRILGLAEGHFPTAEHRDPVLPKDGGRGTAVVERPDRMLMQLHAFDRVVRNASERIAISVSRTDVNGAEREPSALLIDIAAALAPSVPGPAEAARKRRLDHPIGSAASHDRVAKASAETRGAAGPATLLVPSGWKTRPDLDLVRLLELDAAGDHGAAPPEILPFVPGLTKDRPLSPTALRTLLECPYRFLLSTLIGWAEPTSPAPVLEIDPRAFGSLFHRVAESFARAHGAEFGERRRDARRWKDEARAIAGRAFEELVQEYPLAGPDVRRQQLDRLLAAVAVFVDYDWSDGKPRKLFAVEHPFGEPEPLELKPGTHSLHVHGRIDRIDVEGERTLLRDIKTGGAHPRARKEAGPLPKLDVQIAIYGLAAERMARAWGIPPGIEVAYAYVERPPAVERGFRGDDWGDLRDAATRWLDIGARLLAERSFPRTPVTQDCEYCPFIAVCGEAAPGGRTASAPPAEGAAAEFHALRAREA